MNIVMKTNKPVRGEISADYSETGIPDPIELDKARQLATKELDDDGTFNAKFRDNVDKDLNAPMDPIEFENQRRAKDEAEAATDNSIVQITPNPIPGRDKKPIDGWLRVVMLAMALLSVYLLFDAVILVSSVFRRGPAAGIGAITDLIAVYPCLKIVYNIAHRRKTMRAMSWLAVIFVGTVVMETFNTFWTEIGQSAADVITGTTCGWACFAATFFDATSTIVRLVVAIPGYIYFANSKQVKETLIYKEL